VSHQQKAQGRRALSVRDVRYWDEIIKVWREAPPQALWRAHSDAVNRALFSRWLPHGRVRRLLKTDLFDEAVSDGLYPLLASRARLVVGIDVSQLTLQVALARHTDLLAAGSDVRYLPFADDTFDVVVSNSTLDHFETRSQIAVGLRELGRVLRPGGELLLTLDNLANPLVALRNALPFRQLNRLGLVPYYVGATVGPGGLRRLLDRAGLGLREVDATVHCPRVLAVALAHLLERRAAPGIQRGFLGVLMAFEHLARWPTRYVTGLFVAARATKR